tara:strand:+ start:78 stop:1082 length:1005 start_codon:yes stop_codon:yes gene_type:complete
MKIGNFDTDEKVLIIAEIGNNHEGSYTLAEEMIGLAAEAEADAVKFQTIVPERLVSSRQKERIAQLKRFQLTYQEFEKLADVATNEKVLFLSTPFDIDSAQFLNDLVPAFKIASGDNNFFPLLEVIAQTGKPTILSTGFMDIADVKKSVDFIRNIWNENNFDQELALLHCVSTYPTPPEQANLLAIKELQSIVQTVGYSDHTLGIEAAVLSVALGARIIEKHFTIDKNYSDFYDHKLSANSQEMKELVVAVRAASEYLRSGSKILQEGEKKVIESTRRSIVAMNDLSAGTKISMDDLDWVRPGGGLSPGEEEKIVGKSLLKDKKRGDLITLADI